jgi:hypothetical protein
LKPSQLGRNWPIVGLREVYFAVGEKKAPEGAFLFFCRLALAADATKATLLITQPGI